MTILWVWALILAAADEPKKYTINGYDVFIDVASNAKLHSGECGVLVLGTFSGSQAVRESANQLLNPATGRPYDVIIGVGQEKTSAEFRRVVLQGHYDPAKNAEAVKAAIWQHFRRSVEVGSLDMHSNGVPVGLDAVEKGAFTFAKDAQLHLMGPDIGFGGRHLEPDRLNRLRERGVGRVHLHAIHGDVIPGLGEWSRALSRGDWRALRTQYREGLYARMRLAAVAGWPKTIIEFHEYESVPEREELFDAHYIKRYVAKRAAASADPKLIEETRKRMTPPEFDRAVPVRGVRIDVDERLLAEVLSKAAPAEIERVLEEMGSRLRTASDAEGRANVYRELEASLKGLYRGTRPIHKPDALVAISVKTLVEKAERYADRWDQLPPELRKPGGISRLHGFVIDLDREDIVLLGAREVGALELELDDLTVGLRASWKEGTTPLVSLDPDPDDFMGDPQVRIGGVPKDSGFASVMIEADYAMKKILFGTLAVSAEGFRSYRAILENLPPATSIILNRFWLCPVEPDTGDIQLAGDGQSALFCAGAQVLSEEETLIHGDVRGSGRTFEPAEQAAAMLTKHYDAIALEHPVFRRLRALFDVVLLGRIWRNREVRSTLLDRLCALPHRSVPIPRSYPKVVVRFGANQSLMLFGGVEARVGAGSRSWMELDDASIVGLTKRCRDLAATRALSEKLSGASPSLVRQAPRDASNQAAVTSLKLLAAGKTSEALQGIEKAIAERPWDPLLIVVRAYGHLVGNALEEAIRDARRAREMAPDDPRIAQTSSYVLAEAFRLKGDLESAIRESQRCLELDPAGAKGLIAKGNLLGVMGKTEEARAAYRAAVDADPMSPLGYAWLAMLEASEGWVLSARALLARATALSPDSPQVRIAEAFVSLALLPISDPLDDERMKRETQRIERAARVFVDGPGAAPGERWQGLTLLASLYAMDEEWTKLDAILVEADSLAPRNSELLVFAANSALEADQRERAVGYAERAARRSPSDPFVLEILRKLGK